MEKEGKRKVKPRRRFRWIFVIVSGLFIGFFSFSIGDNALENWLYNDPFTPRCNVPNIQVVYTQDHKDGTGLYYQRLDGSPIVELEHTISEGIYYTLTAYDIAWSRDGSVLAWEDLNYDENIPRVEMLEASVNAFDTVTRTPITISFHVELDQFGYVQFFSHQAGNQALLYTSSGTDTPVSTLHVFELPYEVPESWIPQSVSPTQEYLLVANHLNNGSRNYVDRHNWFIVDTSGNQILMEHGPAYNTMEYTRHLIFWTEDGMILFYISAIDGDLYRMDVSSAEITLTASFNSYVTELSMSDDRQYFGYYIPEEGKFHIHSALTGDLLWQFEGDVETRFEDWESHQFRIDSRLYDITTQSIESGRTEQQSETGLFSPNLDEFLSGQYIRDHYNLRIGVNKNEYVSYVGSNNWLYLHHTETDKSCRISPINPRYAHSVR